MSTGTLFQEGSKVVISPDKMRAWVMLAPPAPGTAYTAQDIEKWLPENGVIHGVDANLVQHAAQSKRYHELIEVARGNEAVDATASGFVLKVEKKAFTGLKGNTDGSLFYDDFSFLQEAQAGQALADILPETPGTKGVTVTGEIVEPKPPAAPKTLEGSGFEISEDGQHYIAPTLSHISFVNDQLVVTPLLKLESVTEAESPVEFDGNIFIEKDVHPGSSIIATGSVYVAGRTSSANIQAGRNILLSGGMQGQSGFGKLKAKDNVWGLFFEGCEISAGGSIAANHLSGCEIEIEGKASILGGRGAVLNTHIYAKNGLIAAQLGSPSNDKTVIECGMEKELIDRLDSVELRILKTNQDIQSLTQSITAFERINRNKPDGGKSDAGYREMLARKKQSISVLNIIDNERTRLKRLMTQFSNVSVVARTIVYPGVTISIDTRTLTIERQLQRVKFRRENDEIKAVVASGR